MREQFEVLQMLEQGEISSSQFPLVTLQTPTWQPLEGQTRSWQVHVPEAGTQVQLT